MTSRLLPLFLLLSPPAWAAGPFGVGPRPPAPATGIAAWLLRLQAEFHLALIKAIGAAEQHPSALLALLGLAFAYGVVHAIGPGHGKAVIAAYLVSSERAAKRGIALAFGAALVQALIAFLVVGIVALALGGTGAQMETLADRIGQAGYALIALMGAYIAYRKARALFGQGPAGCEPGCGHEHGPAPENASRGQLVLTAIGAGIRPCSGAIILLVFALSRRLYLAGAVSVAVMALGTAIGTSAFAFMAVKAKQISLTLLSGRSIGLARLVLALELLAGIALMLLGMALVTGSIVAAS